MRLDQLGSAALLLALVAAAPPRALAQADRDPYVSDRLRMVELEIAEAGVANERVLDAMRSVPRHEFVPQDQRRFAYLDMALPIGEGQTISPPFIVAYMTEQLDPQPGDRVLEIGTGSGYQAAVLAELVDEVYTIEIVDSLGRNAARTLNRLGYDNVHVAVGDGYQGWPEAAPFDKIIVTCSPDDVPQPLIEQLAEGGRMVIPLGERYQQVLYLYEKRDGALIQQRLLPVLFVPMTGAAEALRDDEPVDPANPRLRNGGFEELASEEVSTVDASDSSGTGVSPVPAGWHYQRQLTLETTDAPEGRRYATVRNVQPGRSAMALQGFALDGRRVQSLRVSAWVRIAQVAPGPQEHELPNVVVTFYDDNRGPAGYVELGPWRGVIDWRRVTRSLRVPPDAREAVMHVGLLGATGEMSIDDVSIEAVPRRR